MWWALMIGIIAGGVMLGSGHKGIGISVLVLTAAVGILYALLLAYAS